MLALAGYLATVPGVGVADLLNEVENEPGRRDDHQDDEGDGDEHQGAAVDVLGGPALAHHHAHQHRQVALQVGQDLSPVGLGDHHRHGVAGACAGRGRRVGLVREHWENSMY